MYRLILLCLLLLAIMVEVEYRIIENKKDKLIYKISRIWTNFVVAYAIWVLGKVITRDGDTTFYNSFSDATYKTLLMYSVITLVICSVANYILLKIECGYLLRIKLGSMYAILGLIIFIFTENIKNLTMLLLIIACGVIGLIWVLLDKKKIGDNCYNVNFKYNVSYVWPVFAFFSVMYFFFLPNNLFLSNIDEFYFMPYSVCLISSLIGVFGFSVLMTVFVSAIVDEKTIQIISALIFSTGIISYIQYLFMNKDIHNIDGTTQVFERSKIVINSAIWIVVIVAMILFMLVKPKKAKAISNYVSACIIALQVLQIILLIFSQSGRLTSNIYVMSKDGQLQLNSENNTIVFILDSFDTQVLDKINDRDEKFLEPLRDFTYYDNLTSRYTHTNYAIPHIMTGAEIAENDTWQEFTKKAYSETDVIKNIKEQDYDIGIYTAVTLVDESVKDYLINYMDMYADNTNYLDYTKLLYKTSKYSAFPLALKQTYRYDEVDFFALQNRSNLFNCEFDYLFYNDIVNEGISLSDKENGAYRVYHLYGSHVGMHMTEDIQPVGENTLVASEEGLISQAKGSMKVVYSFLDEMKKNNVYDNATIIITADHGLTSYIVGSLEDQKLYNLDNTSNPILFVKMPCESNDITYSTSSVELTQKDILATVMYSICDNKSYFEDAFLVSEVDNNRNIKRYMDYYHDNILRRSFTIDGYVKDWNNWSMVYDQ